jgi:hypothetical protein
MYKEYLAGSIASSVQTLTVYPLDTLKVYKQSKINKPLKLNNLYKGIKYPLMFDIISGSILFGTYYNFKKTYSEETSSLLTGIIIGTIATPFENYKIKNQLHLTKIKLYRGIHLSVFRESIGNYIYFGSYDYFHNSLKYSTAISGGLCGAIMWTVIYPIDYVKTNYIINNNTSISNIIKNNYKNLYNGYKFCLMRAVPANIIIFEVYEKIMEL